MNYQADGFLPFRRGVVLIGGTGRCKNRSSCFSRYFAASQFSIAVFTETTTFLS